jgi:hypothetical protein
MTAITDLGALLAGLEPVLHPGEYAYCSLGDRAIPSGAEPLLTFQEVEGTTLVLGRGQALDLGLPGSGSWAWLTLEVHSGLEAVGLLAAVSAALADHGISCNVVSAYHHDHLLVPWDRGEDALRILRELSRRPVPAR